MITAERFIAIKAKVKKEMQRRNSTGHGTDASMERYAGAEYDFTTVPKKATDINDEHIQKILDPLLKVNDFLGDNSIRGEKSGLEIILDKAEQFVDRLSTISKTASDTGCRGMCKGLCKNTCFGGCQSGCGSGCSGGCRTGCTHTCGSGCTTSMKY